MDVVLGGRYRLTHPLGNGGMGEVWRGTDTMLNRSVAVKVIRLGEAASGAAHDELLKRFRREAQAVAALNHPNVVTAYDFGFDGAAATPYLVMELIDGRSLSAELADRASGGDGPLPLRRALAIAADVCAGLGAAHEAGVVHRDLKPANLMTVTRTGRVKIVDFGIARGAQMSRLTRTGGWLGTVAYMSPEQLMSGDIDGRSDLYALSCVLYELLTGGSPFTATEPAHFLAAHLNGTPRRLRELRPDAPAALDTLLFEMLAKDPDDRPASADAVAARLAALAASAEPARTTVDPPPTTRDHGPTDPAPPDTVGPDTVGPDTVGPDTVGPGTGPRGTDPARSEHPVPPDSHSPTRVDPDPPTRSSTDGTPTIVIGADGPPRHRGRVIAAVIAAVLVVVAGVALALHDATSTSGTGPAAAAGSSPAVAPVVSHGGPVPRTTASPSTSHPVPAGHHATLVTTADCYLQFQAIAFSPDSSQIVGGGPDLCVWSAETGAVVTHHALADPDSGDIPIGIGYSSDGSTIAVGTYDGYLLWVSPLQNYVVTRTVRVTSKENQLTSVAYSPDGRWIAVGFGDSGTILIVDAHTGETLRQDHAPFTIGTGQLAFSPDSGRLAQGSWGSVSIIDPSSGAVIGNAIDPDTEPLSLAFSDDNDLVIGDNTGSISLWSVTSTPTKKMSMPVIDTDKGEIEAIALSPNHQELALVLSTGGTARTTVTPYDPG